MKRSINKKLSSKDFTGYTPLLQQQLDALSCWDFNTNSQCNAADLIRGFIPPDLVRIIESVVKSWKQVITILFKQITKLQFNLYKQVWLPRCEQFAA